MIAEIVDTIEPTVYDIIYPTENEQALTGFTKYVVEEIQSKIKIGMNLNDCAKLLRLPTHRVTNWYNTNYCNFRIIIDEAMATNKLIHVSRVTNAKDNLHVKASSWMLERRYKEEYTKETIINVNHHMIDSIAKIAADTLIRYVPDPDQLQLALLFLQNGLSQLSPQVADQRIESYTGDND